MTTFAYLVSHAAHITLLRAVFELACFDLGEEKLVEQDENIGDFSLLRVRQIQFVVPLRVIKVEVHGLSQCVVDAR